MSIVNYQLPKAPFIGKEKDKESLLDDFGVRKYDDGIGRFTSIDPLWEKNFSWSPYHYCSNSPILNIDPWGLDDFLYNGQYLIYRDNDGNAIWTVEANSGIAEHMNNPESQDLEETGPIPEGEYYLELEPGAPTEITGEGYGKWAKKLHLTWWDWTKAKLGLGRGNFWLHEDGNVTGTLGCIGVIEGGSIDHVIEAVKQYQEAGNDEMDVIVDYDYNQDYIDPNNQTNSEQAPSPSEVDNYPGVGLPPPAM